MSRLNWWAFMEAEEPFTNQPPELGDQPDQTQNQGAPTPKAPEALPSDEEGNEDEDIEDDPEEPDFPEEEEEKDYEGWRGEFMVMSQNADTKEMLASIRPFRDKQLESPQAKFVNDNYHILLYREDANVEKAMKEIRKLTKQDLDRTNPGTTLMQHITTVLDQIDPLKQIPIKLFNAFAIKGELHRKFIAGITGAIQVGGGNRKEDLIYCEKDLTINISTRFATQFGEINLGKWSLKTNDPQEFLSDSELNRLKDGAPEEKQVLRRRIILESMAKRFKTRSFLIHINHPDGSTHALGWDFGESLLSGYHDGKLVVRGNKSDERNAMINDGGDIVSLIDVDIMFIRQTGETDDYGKPETVEVPFIMIKNGTIYLKCDLDTLENSSAILGGMFLKEMPFNGNPSDLKGIRESLPDLKGILNKAY